MTDLVNYDIKVVKTNKEEIDCNSFGKIIEVSSLTLNDSSSSKDILKLSTSNVTSSLTRSFLNRNTISRPLFTGSIMVDFVNPLYQGNMIMFKGARNLGKRFLLDSTVVNFLNDKSKHTKKVVYVTYSKKSAENLKETLDKNSNYIY